MFDLSIKVLATNFDREVIFFNYINEISISLPKKIFFLRQMKSRLDLKYFKQVYYGTFHYIIIYFLRELADIFLII